MPDRSGSTYLQLLEQAQGLGRADGYFAAAFESPGTAVASTECCLGRAPADFARLLWDQPGDPPVGLELNAPLWYAAGFAEGLVRRTAAPQRAAEGARNAP